MRAVPAAVALALIGPALAAGSASAATTPKTVYVTAGGTATCTTSTATNGLPSLDAALACVSNGATIKLGSGSFGTPDALSARTTISANVTVQGAGAGKTTLVNTLEVAAGTTTTVKGVTIDTGTFEAGIINHGTLTVSQSAVTGNQGDVITVDGAGGISNQTELAGQSFSPSLTVLDSTVSGNLDNGTAGGIGLGSPSAGNSDTATIVNSTISGNADGGNAGGIAVENGARLSLLGDTVADNAGGGLDVYGSQLVSVANTLLAGNTQGGAPQTPADCVTMSGATIDGGGHNLVGDADSCAGIAQGASGDLTGTKAAPLDPHLGPLAANGGPTETQALLAGSPAIRAGDPSVCASPAVGGVDQRGSSRKVATRGACDIGAYDTATQPATLHVNAAKGKDSSCAAGTSTKPFATLGFALGCASSGDTVSLGAGSYGTPKQAAAGLVLPDENLTLTGVSAASTTDVEMLLVQPGNHDTIENLTVDTASYNTGIVNEGTLTVSHAVVQHGNGDLLDYYHAGAISNWVVSGGAPALTVLDSTLEANQEVSYAGALYLAPPNAGATDTASVINSTISGNNQDEEAIDAAPGSSLALRDSTVADNVSQNVGGVFSNDAAVSLQNTILAANTTQNGQASDCAMQTQPFTDGGHNLIGDADGCTGLGTAAGDQAGTTAAPLNPGLGALGANGGPTPTQALLPSSPALGTGDPTACQAAPVDDLDQRGNSRNAVSRGSCDVGAFDTGA
jgi:hypothetical protein